MGRSLYVFKRIILVLCLIFVAVITFGLYNTRDRHKDYNLNMSKGFGYEAKEIKVGISKRVITPQDYDTWVDIDSNYTYEPKKGDTYIDRNKNGRFDPIWLAGFHNNRPMNGVLDDLWARSVLFDDGNTIVAIVAIDAIGFFYDDVISVRKVLQKNIPRLDHLIITSTHSHQSPDIQGNWGPNMYRSGVNKRYLDFVKSQIVSSVMGAYNQKHDAILQYAQIDSIPRDLIADTRDPQVFDDGLRLMKIIKKADNSVIGLLINHGNHPETMGSENVLLSSDFVHFLRDGLERNISYNDTVIRKGITESAIFLTGAVGGLMTSGWIDMYDPWLDTIYSSSQPSYAKAKTHGYRLADMVLDLDTTDWITIKDPSIRIMAKTILLDVDNVLFRIASYLGLFDRSVVGWKKVRSEVNLIAIGEAMFLTIPGEINPELLDGGIEEPEGRDFMNDPIENPPLRKAMKGKINFVIGLGNDEIGYIMPKSHWDEKPPFTYNFKTAPYGEVNSLGPNTAPVLHRSILELIARWESNK